MKNFCPVSRDLARHLADDVDDFEVERLAAGMDADEVTASMTMAESERLFAALTCIMQGRDDSDTILSLRACLVNAALRQAEQALDDDAADDEAVAAWLQAREERCEA